MNTDIPPKFLPKIDIFLLYIIEVEGRIRFCPAPLLAHIARYLVPMARLNWYVHLDGSM